MLKAANAGLNQKGGGTEMAQLRDLCAGRELVHRRPGATRDSRGKTVEDLTGFESGRNKIRGRVLVQGKKKGRL